MIKIVVICIAVVALLGGLIFWRIQTANKSEEVAANLSNLERSINGATGDEERLEILEDAVILLSKRLDEVKGSTSTSASASPTSSLFQIEARLKNVENQLSSLPKTSVPSSAQTTTQTTTSKSPLYIPIGSTGTTGNRDYIAIDGFEVVVNPDDYSGYKSMQLEVSMKFTGEAAGTGYGRLYNQTSSSDISSTEVSTTANTYKLLTSGTFTLSSGTQTIKLQGKTTEGYEITFQNARIKVNF